MRSCVEWWYHFVCQSGNWIVFERLYTFGKLYSVHYVTSQFVVVFRHIFTIRLISGCVDWLLKFHFRFLRVIWRRLIGGSPATVLTFQFEFCEMQSQSKVDFCKGCWVKRVLGSYLQTILSEKVRRSKKAYLLFEQYYIILYFYEDRKWLRSWTKCDRYSYLVLNKKTSFFSSSICWWSTVNTHLFIHA